MCDVPTIPLRNYFLIGRLGYIWRSLTMTVPFVFGSSSNEMDTFYFINHCHFKGFLKTTWPAVLINLIEPCHALICIQRTDVQKEVQKEVKKRKNYGNHCRHNWLL